MGRVPRLRDEAQRVRLQSTGELVDSKSRHCAARPSRNQTTEDEKNRRGLRRSGGSRWHGEPQCLLYGTDWPICRMRPYLKFVDDLKLTQETREKIMWKNAARIDKLDLPDK